MVNSLGPSVSLIFLCTKYISFLQIEFQVRQNALSSVRSRSTTTRKAGNLATILIVIGLSHHLPPPFCINLIPPISLTLMFDPTLCSAFSYSIPILACSACISRLQHPKTSSQPDRASHPHNGLRWVDPC